MNSDLKRITSIAVFEDFSKTPFPASTNRMVPIHVFVSSSSSFLSSYACTCKLILVGPHLMRLLPNPHCRPWCQPNCISPNTRWIHTLSHLALASRMQGNFTRSKTGAQQRGRLLECDKYNHHSANKRFAEKTIRRKLNTKFT